MPVFLGFDCVLTRLDLPQLAAEPLFLRGGMLALKLKPG